jgi:hypothetical protein
MIVSIKSVEVTAKECRKLSYVLDSKAYMVFFSTTQLDRDVGGVVYNIHVDVIINNVFANGLMDVSGIVKQYNFPDMYENELCGFDEKFIYHLHNESLHLLKK